MTPSSYRESSKRGCIAMAAGLTAILPGLCLPGCAQRQTRFATREVIRGTATPVRHVSPQLAPVAPAQPGFESPELALEAFIAALRSDDAARLRDILGPGCEEIIFSGDEVADRQARARFLSSYEQNYALVPEGDRAVTLEVGEDHWPFPIPIIKTGRLWSFDTLAGKEEILNRRIGRNELSSIQVCLAIVDAQREYFEVDHDGDGVFEFAQKFISDEGLKNGLYWPAAEGEAASPLGAFAASAALEGYSTLKPPTGEPRPYHGYRFRIISAQGPSAAGGARSFLEGDNLTQGFAVVAWPAEYGNSGIMTFIVNHHGVIFQRDLGPETERVAARISSYDPDVPWTLVDAGPEASGLTALGSGGGQ